MRLQRTVEVQPVEVLLHDHAEHQCRLTLMANAIARRIFIALPHLGHISDAQDPAVGDYRYAFDLLQTVERAIKTDIGPRPGGFHRAGGRHCVLPRQGGKDLLRRQPQGCQPLIGELDVNALRLFSEDVDLLHPRQLQKVLTHALGQLHQLAVWQLPGLQRVEREVNVVIFIVEERAGDAIGQLAGLIAQLLARLVKQFGHQRRRGGIEKLHLHRHETRLRGGLHPVVVVQLLQPLFQPVSDLLLHFPGRRTRPDGGDGHHLDGKRRVFSPAQLAEGKGPGQQHGDDQKQRDGGVADRQRRQIETAHVRGSARFRSRPAGPPATASPHPPHAAGVRPAPPPADHPQDHR